MRRDSDDVSRKTDPQSGNALSGDALGETVDHAFVRIVPVGVGLHLLQFGFDVVERQRNHRADDSRSHSGDNSSDGIVLASELGDELFDLLESG